MADSLNSLAEEIEDVRITLDYQVELNGDLRGELARELAGEVAKLEQLVAQEREDRGRGVTDLQKGARDVEREIDELLSVSHP